MATHHVYANDVNMFDGGAGLNLDSFRDGPQRTL